VLLPDACCQASLKFESDLSFEVRHKDLLGRIGYLRTKAGTLDTPALLPVVNPNSQLIHPQELRDTFSFDALITNSYLVWRKYRTEKDVPRIHDLLNFNGIVETDSGAYQILQYGDVEVQPNEIIRFQERLDSDIAVILDVPTGAEVSKDRAKWTVEETIRRADQSLGLITRNDMLWVGPVQGGAYPDLVSFSAREMAKRNFAIYALGSPTPIMQQYRFETLVDMIMAAKAQLPPSKPLHLFGGGHPMMFALAVALGCDIFDSASYALFARNGRYMTAQGTAKIEELEYFPCNCSACDKRTPEKLRRMLPMDRERILASHNLHACYSEFQTIKQAILDGRLWELVEARSRNHPTLQAAFRRMLEYNDRFEIDTPVRKRKGPFILSEQSLSRPEVIRHQTRLLRKYDPPSSSKKLLLLPEEHVAPFHERSPTSLPTDRWGRLNASHVCSYGLTYAVIPIELADVYPLSQTETSLAPTSAAISFARKRIAAYIKKFGYSSCLIIGCAPWHDKLAAGLKQQFKGKVRIRFLEEKEIDKKAFQRILKALK
jgi:7-cyano-7-deazaguanine tRNA-ribosyltransferase